MVNNKDNNKDSNKAELLKAVDKVLQHLSVKDISKSNEYLYSISKFYRNKSVVLKALVNTKISKIDKDVIAMILALRKIYVLDNPDKFKRNK